MKKIYLIATWSIFCCLFPFSVSAFEFGTRGYYWFPSLDGTLKVDDADAMGTEIDFEQDLGLDDDEFPAGEVFVRGGKHHLSLAYTKVDYSGKKILERSITFNGETYSASDEVTSSLEYDMFDLYYQYDLLNLENVLAGFSMGGVAQVKYLDGEVNLKTSTIDQKEDFAVPIPMVGMNARLELLADLLEARVRGTGMAYSGNTMYEFLGELSWTPFPFVDIHGGYKMFMTDVDEDDVDFDYDMAGAFVAVTVSF